MFTDLNCTFKNAFSCIHGGGRASTSAFFRGDQKILDWIVAYGKIYFKA